MNLVKYVRPVETRIRAPRMEVDQALVVDSKTLGTTISYRLTTMNVSKSGLLLQWTNESHVPFIVNTLIELTIDPGRRWLPQPVPCLGKVVRREEVGVEGARFGVRIVQIDNADLEAWEGCIKALEKEAGHLTEQKSEAKSDEPQETHTIDDSISLEDLKKDFLK